MDENDAPREKVNVADDETPFFVVGVDFGTTYSGAAYCHSATPFLDKITPITRWKGEGDISRNQKIPTVLRYLDHGRMQWGYEALDDRSMEKPLYSWFKLHLDQQSTLLLHKASALSLLQGESYALPADKSATEICSDYMKLLYEHIINHLILKEGKKVVDITPIHWVLSVPAMWSHSAKEETKEAARIAGFLSREGDKLDLVAEPEAAARYALGALHDSHNHANLKVGQSIIVCDAGGGTCDIITYRVTQLDPCLKLEEVVIGQGDTCGATNINRAFRELLEAKFDMKIVDDPFWKPEYVDNGSDLMERLERYKRGYKLPVTTAEFKKYRFPLPGELPDNYLEHSPARTDVRGRMLLLNEDEMFLLFNRTVQRVIRLVEKQMKASRKETTEVTTVILVGGFGQSDYLLQELKEWCEKQTPTLDVINPKESWSAIMRGAVWHGLNPHLQPRRKLRLSYGVIMVALYEEKLHKNMEVHFDPEYGKTVRAIHWLAHINTFYDDNTLLSVPGQFRFLKQTPKSERSVKLKLYSSSFEDPPVDPKSSMVHKLATTKCDVSKVPESDLLEIETGFDWINKIYKGLVRIDVTFHSAEVLKFEARHRETSLGRVMVSYNTEDVVE